jgi:hypothetical protein
MYFFASRTIRSSDRALQQTLDEYFMTFAVWLDIRELIGIKMGICAVRRSLAGGCGQFQWLKCTLESVKDGLKER